MRTLFHLPLCPFSRKVRLVLGEYRLDFEKIAEPVWKQREEFMELNPAGLVPVLVDLNQQVFCDSTVICEYLDEAYAQQRPLVGEKVLERAEVRRIVSWFDGHFNQNITRRLVFEKTYKRHMGLGGPDSRIIRQGHQDLAKHLDYFSWLLERRNWFCGMALSMADLAAAAHLSCIDYMGHMPWEDFPVLKEWYSRIKSRPSMRPLLHDAVPGIRPSDHYGDLDF